MNVDLHQPFVFYLLTGDKLDSNFELFAKLFRENSMILVPIKMEQIPILTSGNQQIDYLIICSVSSFKSKNFYQRNIRKKLKYLLRRYSFLFYLFTSFSDLDDSRSLTFGKNYFVKNYPFEARHLVVKIAKYFDERKKNSKLWPGTNKVRVPGVLL